MRIRSFCKLVENETEKHILKNSDVVVDAQNTQFHEYKKAKIPFLFGCECDQFSKNIRKLLNMFRKNNVECYFIFKGGDEDLDIKIKKLDKENRNKTEIDDFIRPIFLKNVFKEVLDEFGIHYVVCEYESKKACIALAQKLECPLLSFDIEFCFSGVDYIPFYGINFNGVDNQIECGLFKLDKFLRNYNLTDEKITLFILLTEENIFPTNTFLLFFKYNKIPYVHRYYARICCILKWLARHSREDALRHIFRYITPENRKKFLEEECKVKNILRRKESGGLPIKYLVNRYDIEIKDNDPQWFVKGIILKYIAIPYINLYRSEQLLCCDVIADKNADHPLLLSIEIIRYAYDLLTDFQNKKITLLISLKSEITFSTSFVRKPEYEANSVVFENGWNRLRPLKLFEHFLNETIQQLNFDYIEQLPEDARLLIIALVYFSHKKSVDTKKEVYSVLLSYIMLGVVFQKVYETQELNVTVSDASIHYPTVFMDVTEYDCNNASKEMNKYFEVNESDGPNPTVNHPLVEFQHCFDHLNYLNTLCGSPYKPTVYSKTYNGTFVYNILCAIKKENCDGLNFIQRKLNSAPTVLAFITGLIEIYDKLMY